MAAKDYKYQFVSPPPDDVICPLCLDIVEEPHQLTCCGHHICKKCVENHRKRASSLQCPMCRHNKYGTVHDKYFERNGLNKLTIWCTKGCGQKVELGQLKKHFTQCLCVQEDCPYGCGQQYQRQFIEEHKEKCSKRPFICGYCKYQSTYEVIVNEHYPVCDKYPIICPNECSGDEIERGMLQDHLDKCPFQVVECEFSYVGCQEKVRRCDLAQHLSDNGIHHSALSSKMIYESLQKMMEEKDRQLQEKEAQIAEKDRELKEVIQEKDRQLQEKDKQLQEKDRQLQEKVKQLQEKETQLVKKDNELKLIVQQKDKQLQKKDRHLQEKDAQLVKKDNELKFIVQQENIQLWEKDRQLQEKNTQLIKKDNELKLTVQQKDKQIEVKDRQLQEKDDLLFKFHELREENKTLLGTIYDKICDDTVLSVTMTDFTYKERNRVHWFSPPYFTHLFGYQMCFEVDLDDSNRNRLLYIDSYMMKGPYDDHLQWPFKEKVIVQLLNQCGNYYHYDYVFDYNDKEQRKRVTSGEQGIRLQTQSRCLSYNELGITRPMPFPYLCHQPRHEITGCSASVGQQDDYQSDSDDDNCQYLLNDSLKFIVLIPRYH